MKVKTNSLADTLLANLATSTIMSIKDKIKNHKKIDDIDWVDYKNYFVYDHNFSDKKLLKSQIESLSMFKKII